MHVNVEIINGFVFVLLLNGYRMFLRNVACLFFLNHFRTTVFDERYVDDKVKMIKKASKMVRKRMKSVSSPERVSPMGNFQVLRIQ